jgi:hypothetical protein
MRCSAAYTSFLHPLLFGGEGSLVIPSCLRECFFEDDDRLVPAVTVQFSYKCLRLN